MRTVVEGGFTKLKSRKSKPSKGIGYMEQSPDRSVRLGYPRFQQASFELNPSMQGLKNLAWAGSESRIPKLEREVDTIPKKHIYVKFYSSPNLSFHLNISMKIIQGQDKINSSLEGATKKCRSINSPNGNSPNSRHLKCWSKGIKPCNDQ